MKKRLQPIRLVLFVFYQCSCMVRPLPDEVQYPLPQKVTPERYEVTIEHYIDEPIPYYSGQVRIKIHCIAPTNSLNFNLAGDLKIKSDVIKLLSKADESQFTIINKNSYNGNQLELVLDKSLEKDKMYEVYIEFSCPFADSQGYILKTYGNDSHRKIMTFTKLNEFDARRVIPCFDQINMKAKFKMWLLHPKRLTSFSNAEVKSREDVDTSTKPNWVKVEFHETDYMATFSIAMALAQFQTTGFHFSSNVNVKTWADEDVIERMFYINKLASESFKFFSKLFGVPHPMKKLDILILPDVEFEIEESYGIIFMSQKYVLDTLNKSNNPTTYEMVLKICHAVSYQWIGSTVTMSQWKDTWFHQGLNYLLQEECAKEIFPEYSQDILQLNMIESFLGFMRSEETAVYGEPITILKSYPNFTYTNFVTIEKVYHLIRMVQFIMKPKLFNEGLAKYVQDFRCMNSELNDALDVFTKKANSVDPPIFKSSNIQKFLKSWLDQTGVPRIVIKRDCLTKKLIFRQVVFDRLKLDKAYEESSAGRYWLISLIFATEKEAKFDEVSPRIWLGRHEQGWSPPVEFNTETWFLCDFEFNVPGRVSYDDKTWKLIQEFFVDESKFKKINALTRARLVSDMFTLAEAGELKYEILFKTMEYLQHEEEYIPWMIALKEFDRIRSRMLGCDFALFERYQKFVRKILEPGFQKLIIGKFLQNPREHSVKSEFQILFIEISCKFDLEECSKRSSELNQMWDGTSNFGRKHEIHRRLYKVVLCEQVKHGNQEKWNSLWKHFYEKENQSSKEDILQAFGCLQKEKDLQRLLEKSINDPQISREERIIIFQSLSSNKNGFILMKDFFKKFYKQITSFHSEGEPSQLLYLRILFDATNRMRHLNEIVQFAISKKVLMVDKLTVISMGNARRNITWRQRNKKDLKHSLNNNKLMKFFNKIINIFKFK